MFDIFILMLAESVGAYSWEEVEEDYYNFMNKYELEDSDIYDYTINGLKELIKNY